MFGSFFSGLTAKLLAALGIAVALLAALGKLLNLQKKADRAAGMESQLRNVETKDEVAHQIAGADSADRQRLRTKYTRPE